MKPQQSTFLARAVAVLCVSCLPHSALCAQTPGDSAGSQNNSWTSVTEPQNSEGAIPVRTKITHTVRGKRTMETQSLQRMDTGGNYAPYRDVETETVRVNETTVRTIERSYARDSEGQRRLVQVIQEESRTLPGGEVKTDRTKSTPDLSGSLQVVHQGDRGHHADWPRCAGDKDFGVDSGYKRWPERVGAYRATRDTNR